MDELIIFCLYVLAPVGLLVFLTFLLNLVRAPVEMDYNLCGMLEETKSGAQAKILELESQRDALAKQLTLQGPKLSLEINQVAVGEPSGELVDQLKNAPVVTVTATIRNTGWPSIAELVQCTITLADTSNPVTIEPLLFYNTMTLLHEDQQPPTTIIVPTAEDQIVTKPGRPLHPDDQLFQKGMTPIPCGGAIRGSIMFAANSMMRDEIIQAGTVLELVFKDINQTEVSGREIFGSGWRQDASTRYPGMRA